MKILIISIIATMLLSSENFKAGNMFVDSNETNATNYVTATYTLPGSYTEYYPNGKLKSFTIIK